MKSEKIKEYSKILKEIKQNDDKYPVSIYCDDVNRDYKYDLSNMNNKASNSMDMIFSDGQIEPFTDEQGEVLFQVKEASYVIIKTISNIEGNSSIITDYSVIFDTATFGFIQSLILQQNDMETFDKITNKDKYAKGDITNFKIKNSGKSVVIYPLKEKRKQKIRTI